MAQLVQSRSNTSASLLAAVALAVLMVVAIVGSAIALGLPAALVEPAAAPAAPAAQQYPRTWQLAAPAAGTTVDSDSRDGNRPAHTGR